VLPASLPVGCFLETGRGLYVQDSGKLLQSRLIVGSFMSKKADGVASRAGAEDRVELWQRRSM
jgi:hypothetical protein